MFGEYMPFVEYAPWLQHFTPLTGKRYARQRASRIRASDRSKGQFVVQASRLLRQPRRLHHKTQAASASPPASATRAFLSHVIRGQSQRARRRGTRA